MGIGSHQPAPTGDLYTELQAQESKNIKFVEIPAHNYEKCRPGDTDEEKHGEWCLLWPQMLPFWFLEAQRESMGDVMFEVCYNQAAQEGVVVYFPEEMVRGDYPVPEIDPERGVFDNPDLRFVKAGILDRTRTWNVVPSCCGRSSSHLLVALGFDPAAGENKRSSESALTITGGCRYCGRRYIIDYWHGRQSPEQHPDTILDFIRSYPQIQRARIEINAYQKALARDPRLVEQQSRLGFILEEWTTTDKKRDPYLGIPVLSRHGMQGKLSIPYSGLPDEQKAEDFLKSLLRWPKEPNDIPMSWWLADLSVAEMIEAVNFHTPSHMHGYDDIPDNVKESEFTISMRDFDELE
jgi:hypothetical protein